MEITVKLSLPDLIYRFYADASHCIHGRTPEDVMADALTAYAGLLSPEITRQISPVIEAEVEL